MPTVICTCGCQAQHIGYYVNGLQPWGTEGRSLMEAFYKRDLIFCCPGCGATYEIPEKDFDYTHEIWARGDENAASHT